MQSIYAINHDKDSQLLTNGPCELHAHQNYECTSEVTCSVSSNSTEDPYYTRLAELAAMYMTVCGKVCVYVPTRVCTHDYI